MKIDKKAVLTGLAAVFGAGAFVVNVLSEKDKLNETAQKAAEIVSEQLKDKN